MSCKRSLSTQLVVMWILCSFVAYFSLPVTVFLPLAAFHIGDSSNTTLESWTTKRAKDVLVGALRPGRDGVPFIEKTPELARHLARNAHFRYAIYLRKEKRLAAGSDERLFEALGNVRGADSFSGLFHVLDDPDPNARGYVRSVDTPFGKVTIATYGADFHWDDALWQLESFFSLQNFISFLPLGSAAALVASIVVRRSLAPLRAATERVRAIDMNSLGNRLNAEGLPQEVAPFVRAVDAALARVDEGVATQRRFTANAAHELRTPVTVLRARASEMDPSPLKNEILRDVRRLQTVVDQLLDLAQTQQRGVQPRSAIDLGRTVLELTADFMPIAIDAGKEIAYEPPTAVVRVDVFRGAIESVVMNLIENALRVEPVGGVVCVRVTADARIEVVDHGPGIDRQHRNVIFEPFWRGDDSPPGAGLGLSIVRELVSSLGGDIHIDDTPGGGATFVVRLPGSSQSAA